MKPARRPRFGLRVYAACAAVAAVGFLGVLLGVAYRRSQTLASLDHERRACEGGDAAGCQRVGWEYEQGALVAQDLPRALRYYQRACGGGYALGCFFAGTLFEGRGARSQALGCYRQACAAGPGEACRGAERLAKRGLLAVACLSPGAGSR